MLSGRESANLLTLYAHSVLRWPLTVVVRLFVKHFEASGATQPVLCKCASLQRLEEEPLWGASSLCGPARSVVRRLVTSEGLDLTQS